MQEIIKFFIHHACIKRKGLINETGYHFSNYDRVISNYNDNYYRPALKLMDSLYSLGVLSRRSYFDEGLEWDFYEFWHYEGRRARMGTAMMAPDYSWWHGFYELKHRFVNLFKEAEKVKRNGSYIYPHFPSKVNQKKY